MHKAMNRGREKVYMMQSICAVTPSLSHRSRPGACHWPPSRALSLPSSTSLRTVPRSALALLQSCLWTLQAANDSQMGICWRRGVVAGLLVYAIEVQCAVSCCGMRQGDVVLCDVHA